MIYQWKDGSRKPGEAQVVGEEIARIASANGGVAIPAEIVRAAKPLTSPIHSYFEWSNSKAAKLYREDQARMLVRSIVEIRETEDSSEPRQTVAFVHVRIAGSGSGYMSTSRVMSNAELRAQAIRECLSLLNGIKRRFEHLTELGNVFAEIDHAMAAMSEEDAA